jgi:hypothetical protein
MSLQITKNHVTLDVEAFELSSMYNTINFETWLITTLEFNGESIVVSQIPVGAEKMAHCDDDIGDEMAKWADGIELYLMTQIEYLINDHIKHTVSATELESILMDGFQF